MWLFVIHLQRSEITITEYFLNKKNKKHAQIAEPQRSFPKKKKRAADVGFQSAP